MKMNRKNVIKGTGIVFMLLVFTACNVPSWMQKSSVSTVPMNFRNTADSLNSADIRWHQFFADSNLIALIDSALKNNQELNIMKQEIFVSQNDIREKKSAYLPFVGANAGAQVDKVGRYTSKGANDANTPIKDGKAMPEPLPDYLVSLNASWEVDVWKKLRNSKKAAVHRYLASTEGKNFMVTNMIAEIAHAYYELMAYDNQLEILKQNIAIQTNALAMVKLEKEAAKVTELAVRKFEAEVLKNQSNQYYIMQKITETENRINFLIGRFPQEVKRNSKSFVQLSTDSLHMGVPSQLLANRPDIRKAEQELIASKLDVKVAKAEFYPSFMIESGLGYQAFNPKFLLQTPESMLYGIVGGLAAPLVNRNAIKARFYTANSKQVQAAYNYEKTILNAYVEVLNQISNISNLKKSYDLKIRQVQALTESITISSNLFKSARANYMEVLLTQRDALESKFELIEIKNQQMNAKVNLYRALGGGWR